MTIKRKSRNVINEYDQSWLLGLYRWLRLEKTQVIHLKASPQFCRHKINALITRSNRFEGVETQEMPYEFRVLVSEDDQSHTGAGTVIGRVIAESDGTSTVILRAYPINSAVGCVGLILWPALLGTIYYGYRGGFAKTTLYDDVCIGFAALILMFLVWYFLFGRRKIALNFLSHALEPLANDKPEKSKNIPEEEMDLKSKNDGELTHYNEAASSWESNE